MQHDEIVDVSDSIGLNSAQDQPFLLVNTFLVSDRYDALIHFQGTHLLKSYTT